MNTHKIAIVGMSCCLPEQKSLNEFKQWLFNGESKPSVNTFFDKAWLDSFDHELFRLSEKDTRGIDPQQKLFLALTHWGLQDANIDVTDVPQNTGVFVGASVNEFLLELIESLEGAVDPLLGLGNAFIANRVSHFYNLTGPSIAVDAACCSSTVAIKNAVMSLASNEVDMAIAGGVQLLMSQTVTDCLEKSGLVSKSKVSKPFSTLSDGYVRSEGGATVILKRLEDAVANNDNIYAVIEGVFSNHNGTSLTLVSPRIKSQVDLYQKAMDRLTLSAEDFDYIEASANGTAMSDMAEYRSISSHFQNRINKSPLLVGVNKGQLGNLEAASGVVSLIKTALILHANRTPKQNINSPIFSDHDSIKLNFDEYELKESKRKTFAAVNSFGLGGVNSHIVLANPPIRKREEKRQTTVCRSFFLSASSKVALIALAKSIAKHLKKSQFISTEMIHYFSASNQNYAHRVVINYQDIQALVCQLETLDSQYLENVKRYNHSPRAPLSHLVISDDKNINSSLKKAMVANVDIADFYSCAITELEHLLNIELPTDITETLDNSVGQYEQLHNILLGFFIAKSTNIIDNRSENQGQATARNSTQITDTINILSQCKQEGANTSLSILDDFGSETLSQFSSDAYENLDELLTDLFLCGFAPLSRNFSNHSTDINQPILYPIFNKGDY